MAAPQGFFDFPGIGRYVEARYTLQHGISPSVCMVTMVPQAGFSARGGPMRFRFGSTTLTFPDCIVDQHEIITTERGQLWQLTIFDRRWRWAFGEVSGTYNLRTDDGKLIKSTEKKPQDLCSMLLKAMGESGFDVSRVPNESRPAVEWDYDNPAEALAELCDELRCRVVLQLDNKVSLYPIGQGGELPRNASVVDDSLSIDPPELPSAIKIVGGRSRFEGVFLLEAVGLDDKEAIKPIDELSYKPSGGWANVDFPAFLQITSASMRELAKRSVFKWYRVKTPALIPGYGPFQDSPNSKGGQKRPVVNATNAEYLWQVLPLEEERVTTEVLQVGPNGLSVDPKGVNRNKPAQLHGKFWRGDDDFENSYTGKSLPINATNATLFLGQYNINNTAGIIEFSEPKIELVKGVNNDFTVKPATFVLRVACSMRDKDSRAVHRYERERRLGNFGTGTKVIRNEDLVLGCIGKFKGNTGNYQVEKVTDNRKELDQEADKLLDQAIRELEVSLPYSRTYAGLFPIGPDGAIQQVTWAVTESGAFTQASRNYESASIGNLNYGERRIRERGRHEKRFSRRRTTAQLRKNLTKAQVN